MIFQFNGEDKILEQKMTFLNEKFSREDKRLLEDLKLNFKKIELFSLTSHNFIIQTDIHEILDIVKKARNYLQDTYYKRKNLFNEYNKKSIEIFSEYKRDIEKSNHYKNYLEEIESSHTNQKEIIDLIGKKALLIYKTKDSWDYEYDNYVFYDDSIKLLYERYSEELQRRQEMSK